ncbi:MAG: methylmalonyl Co-A mutase-associated GTPase MeaB [Rhodospirillaceae bacterium]|jgi:LAO/AO transport system kinase|nr:methylmalonyl Co-A mutase-associated GTPase MeaB [Rhodospirillaceae bacterium]
MTLSANLVERVLAGETRAMARMMSYAESTRAEHRTQLADIYGHAGKAHLVGLTGVPGSGKSTLVRSMTLALREQGKRVGIVAVDPSSPFSGGAILGDRVRMADLATDDGVFIRSLATRGSLGGLARAALDTADVLDAAGFDVVLIETVGVGQDEVDIATAAHTVIVVSAPGLGDGIQAIKAGVLEIADMHVVSKCDRPDANKTVSDLKAMLGLGLTGRGPSKWEVPVIPTSAETGEGVETLVETIGAHSEHLRASGELVERQRKIAEMRVLKTAEDIVRERIEAERNGGLGPLLEKTASREMDPLTAAHKLLRDLKLES